MKRTPLLLAPICLALLSACGSPDPKALQTLACQQAANTVDLQSVAQLDLLRKALGLAPDVDPLGTCRTLGVDMKPKAPARETSGDSENQEQQEN